jgi:hypothetical protein
LHQRYIHNLRSFDLDFAIHLLGCPEFHPEHPGQSTPRRTTLVLAGFGKTMLDSLVIDISGFGRIVVTNIPRQFPNNKFLKEIGGGSCANLDSRVFKR